MVGPQNVLKTEELLENYEKLDTDIETKRTSLEENELKLGFAGLDSIYYHCQLCLK